MKSGWLKRSLSLTRSDEILFKLPPPLRGTIEVRGAVPLIPTPLTSPRTSFPHKGERRLYFRLFLLISTLLPLTIFVACNGSGGENSSAGSTSRKLFVVNSDSNTIAVFDVDRILNTEPDENGDLNVPPLRSIGSVSGLSTPHGIFVDTVNDEIFVTNTENNSISVYENDRTREGSIDIPPKRIIKGNLTGLSSPAAVFVAANEIFVANVSDAGGSITVYKNDGSQTGAVNVSPERIIGGESSRILVPSGLFVDTENDEIFVADFNGEDRTGNILVFERTADVALGEVHPIRVITIEDTTDEGFPFIPRSVYVDAANDELFVADFGVEVDEFSLPFPVQEGENLGSTIKVFSRTAADTDPGVPPSPLRTIRGPSTGLLNPLGISLDTKRDEIFAVNFFNNTVTVYENDRTGEGDLDIPPSRILFIRDSNNSGHLGDRFNSAGIFVDVENEEIFVANQNNTITAYRSMDEGNVDPVRTIGSNTGLLKPEWIYVDAVNGEIFVSNARSRLITVYDIADEGNAAPLRTLSQGLLAPAGISVDEENGVIFVAGNGSPYSIRAYRTRDGTTLNVIFGANTGLDFPEGLYLDTKNGEIFVANFLADTVTVYKRGNAGNVVPLRTIKLPEFASPEGVFVDTEHDEILVASLGENAILVFDNDRMKTGDQYISPKRTIKGPKTRVLQPRGVFADTQYDLVFVTNPSEDDNTLTVFENNRMKTGDQDIKPIRTVRGAMTGLSKPIGIFAIESH